MATPLTVALKSQQIVRPGSFLARLPPHPVEAGVSREMAGALSFSPVAPYWQKLQDPRWQRKRLEILQRDEFVCQHCMDETATLHVDHAYYEAGKQPWEYPSESLVTLCRTCHERIEALRLKLLMTLRRFDPLELQRVIGFALAVREWTVDTTNATPNMEQYESFGWSVFADAVFQGTGDRIGTPCTSPVSESP